MTQVLARGYLIEFNAVVDLAYRFNLQIDVHIFHQYDEIANRKANRKEAEPLARKRIRNSEAHINNWLVEFCDKFQYPMLAALWIRWGLQKEQRSMKEEHEILPHLRARNWYLFIGRPVPIGRGDTCDATHIHDRCDELENQELRRIFLSTTDVGGLAIDATQIHRYATRDVASLKAHWDMNIIHAVREEKSPADVAPDSDSDAE